MSTLQPTELNSDEEMVEVDEKAVNPPNYRLSMEDFKNIALLGTGGYGKVYLAQKITQPNKDQLFAIKTLRKAHIVRSAKDVDHTRTERSILESVKSPFICDLIYAFQTGGKLYLVLEYLSGGELFTRLEKHGVFPEETARFYLAEIIIALEHLHKNGITYRDLKPENVMLDATGHVKLTDFGLSKVHVDDEKTNTFCGTIEFMSPEIILRKGHGREVDWWSLGALMYDMLIGGSPFHAETRKEIMNKIINGKISIPFDAMSKNARKLIRALLRRDVSKRLGAGPGDSEEIKRHPFFKDLDWEMCKNRKLEPPFKPELKRPDDVSHFDTQFTDRTPKESECPPLQLRESEHNPFHGFTYVSPDVEHHHSIM